MIIQLIVNLILKVREFLFGNIDEVLNGNTYLKDITEPLHFEYIKAYIKSPIPGIGVDYKEIFVRPHPDYPEFILFYIRNKAAIIQTGYSMTIPESASVLINKGIPLYHIAHDRAFVLLVKEFIKRKNGVKEA